jgi:hypothetical protein
MYIASRFSENSPRRASAPDMIAKFKSWKMSPRETKDSNP